jgi:hypothetical protein
MWYRTHDPRFSQVLDTKADPSSLSATSPKADLTDPTAHVVPDPRSSLFTVLVIKADLSSLSVPSPKADLADLAALAVLSPNELPDLIMSRE